MSRWLRLMLPGDWLTVLLATTAVALSYPLLWHGGAADRVEVRRDGTLIAELPLGSPRRLVVKGALGDTEIEVALGRARIVSDPGPRQYCVKQGWLTRPDAIAICAPSHISLALTGRATTHDSLSY